MPCAWITSDLQLRLILTLFLVAECLSAGMEGPITSNNSMQQMDNGNHSSVAITHDGNYTCHIVTLDGNFQHGYHFQVLVPPEVTLIQTENGTAVCKAAAGKPAAQISWTPEGDCVTEQELYWGDGTVTVQSACRWGGHHVPAVFCSVSHLTGNKSLSIQLERDTNILSLSSILYIILPIFTILVIVGSIWLLKSNRYRKCKFKKTEHAPVVEEDEMEPYASYTEKNNPLYDITNRVKTSQVLQSEADGMNLRTIYVPGVLHQDK
ncbi:cell surface glycoprotein CD200 receptor 1 isoform 3-T3 [Dama dama]